MSYEWLGFPQAARDFSKRFPYFSKKLLKKQTKVPQKLLEKKQKTFFWSDAKICNLYNKSKISKHFVQFCGVTSVAK